MEAGTRGDRITEGMGRRSESDENRDGGGGNSNSASSSSSNELLSDISNSSLLSLPQSKWRAKLYQLNTSGSWDDFGTGEFQVVKDVSHYFLSQREKLTNLLDRTMTMSTTCC